MRILLGTIDLTDYHVFVPNRKYFPTVLPKVSNSIGHFGNLAEPIAFYALFRDRGRTCSSSHVIFISLNSFYGFVPETKILQRDE